MPCVRPGVAGIVSGCRVCAPLRPGRRWLLESGAGQSCVGACALRVCPGGESAIAGCLGRGLSGPASGLTGNISSSTSKPEDAAAGDADDKDKDSKLKLKIFFIKLDHISLAHFF